MQVLNDEPGLADCWFPGQVVETSGQHVLAAYNDLQDERIGQALREWFPLHGCERDLVVETPHTIHNDGHCYRVRPAPPQEVRACLAWLREM